MATFLSLNASAQAKKTGNIAGKAIDELSGEAMIGMVVTLENTSFGTVTDMDGNYRLANIPEGTYNVKATLVGYNPQVIKGFKVKAGNTVELSFSMSLINGDVVTIYAVAKTNTEMTAILQRQKADAVVDILSAQEIGRTGASNAAESMKQVTGASVEGGKYMVMRGLGDRYSIAQLNGVTLPGTDPYRNSTNLDLIPSSMLENITTTKTFTPDQPGNFTGGSLNITTRSFPNSFVFDVNIKSTYNLQSSFNKNFLTYDGGKYDALGYDDGTREMPSILQDKSVRDKLSSQSYYITARSNPEEAKIFNESINSLSRQFTPGTMTSPLDNKINMSIGNQYAFNAKKRIGFMLGANYSRNYTYYEDGISGGYQLSGGTAEELTPFFDFKDTRSVENPQLGGLGNVSFQFNPKNRISANVLYNHDAEKTARYQVGAYPGALANQSYMFETRTLSWKERQVLSTQLSGKHSLTANNMELEWIAGHTNSNQAEPDLRFYANSFDPSTSSYYMNKAEYDHPFHFFRNLTDKQDEAKIDLSIPIGHTNLPVEKTGDANDAADHTRAKGKLKFGASYSNKTRVFNEYRFQVEDQGSKGLSYSEANGNTDDFFGAGNTGIIDTVSGSRPYVTGLWSLNQTQNENQYTGHETILGAYAMTIYPITSKLKFVGGVRVESTDIEVASGKPNAPKGVIKTLDPLPSVNLVYAINEKMALRTAATRTLARPNMRELAPFAAFDFIGGFIYRGNDQLKRSLIQNYDARWEWFPRASEVISASLFYKRFQDPIIKVYSTQAASPEIKFDNVDKASAYGMELEFRKGLDVVSPSLKNFKIGTNFSLIYSRVKVNDDEYKAASSINKEFKTWRPFQGQAPYIVNAILSYKNDSARIESTLSFNIAGTSLSEVGQLGTPDVYEVARPILNYNIRYGITSRLTASLFLNNLFNPAYEKKQTYNGMDFITQSYKVGRSVGISLGYSIR